MPSLAGRESKHGSHKRPALPVLTGKEARKAAGAWGHEDAGAGGIEMSEIVSAPGRPLTEAERQEMVATAAYYIAEKRGFNSGDELADWFAAEDEIAAMLKEH